MNPVQKGSLKSLLLTVTKRGKIKLFLVMISPISKVN